MVGVVEPGSKTTGVEPVHKVGGDGTVDDKEWVMVGMVTRIRTGVEIGTGTRVGFRVGVVVGESIPKDTRPRTPPPMDASLFPGL